MLVSPNQDRAMIDVIVRVEKHCYIIPELLVTHGLTGCDTESPCYGIGEGGALKLVYISLTASVITASYWQMY